MHSLETRIDENNEKNETKNEFQLQTKKKTIYTVHALIHQNCEQKRTNHSR